MRGTTEGGCAACSITQCKAGCYSALDVKVEEDRTGHELPEA